MDSQESNSIAELLPLITQSVIRKKKELSESFNSAISSTVSKIGEFKTNIIYSVKHSDLAPLSRKEIQIKQSGPAAQLLGHSYTWQTSHKFLYAFRTTFWMTYRKGIKEIQSDNGWGCMIRTVQMVFAEVLKRNLSIKDTEKDQYEIIRYFCEQSDGVLSLSAICRQGQINKRWTSSLQIFAAFKNIMKKNKHYFNFSFEVYSSGITYKAQQQMLMPSYPALVSISNRVSLESIPEEYYGHYFELMDHPSWVGSIGGLQGQALYILGSYENKVIFLDPHYVQSNEEELQVQTYFCKSPRGIDISALSPSLSFCYYFATKEDHLKWIRWISKTCEKRYPDLVFEFMEEMVKNRLDREVQKKEKEQSLGIVVEDAVQEESDDKVSEKEPLDLIFIARQHEDSGEFEVLE